VRSLQAAQDADRVLATVLFTDLVDSTKQAAAFGDRAWTSLIERHDEEARTYVKRWMGEYVKATGDGFIATFDTPTRALRCAFDIRQAIALLGLEMRAAIHTGEIERRDDDLGGIAVNIASRVLGEAEPGQVVVTRTVLDLATGVDLTFAPSAPSSCAGSPAAGSCSKRRSIDSLSDARRGDTLGGGNASKRESESRPHAGIVRVRTRGLNQTGDVCLSYTRSFLVYKRDAMDEIDHHPTADQPWPELD
jgi:hypothetical protein